MTPKGLFSKTMPFVWAKLFLGLATVLASALVFGVLMGIAWLFNSGEVGVIMLIIWIGVTGTIRLFLNHYLGYLVKAGHIAVLQEAITTGKVPSNQVEYGKQMVKDRFATSNVYFAVDKLVSGAVKQIQNSVNKFANALDFIPGMDSVAGLANFFISISLGYIDECCLGYTFYKKEDSAYKSAADGVMIYAQNWKVLLKDAAKAMILVIVGMIVITLALFLVLGILFRILNLSGFVAFIIALLIAFAVKSAFMDSYILVRTMVSYMEVAPTTELKFDLYGKLCVVSSKFKELFNKGQQEQPMSQPAYAAANGAAVTSSAAANEEYTFCEQCGEELLSGTIFCGKCGARQ